MLATKQCLRCGITLTRRVRPSGNRESSVKFRHRQHCSAFCRLGRAPRARPAVACAFCHAPTARAQKFCSLACRNLSYIRVPTTEKQGRNQAQKRYALKPCEQCGATTDVHRHHRDHNPLNNHPSNIGFFCSAHHYAHHAETRLLR